MFAHLVTRLVTTRVDLIAAIVKPSVFLGAALGFDPGHHLQEVGEALDDGRFQEGPVVVLLGLALAASERDSLTTAGRVASPVVP